MGLEFEVNLKPQVDAISQPAWILETLLLDVSLRYEVEGLGELLPNLQQLLGGMDSEGQELCEASSQWVTPLPGTCFSSYLRSYLRLR